MAEIKVVSIKNRKLFDSSFKITRSKYFFDNKYLDFFRLHFYFVTSIRRAFEVGSCDDVMCTIQGKIEMEISILKAEEADENPAGRGRESPQELPPPKYETLLKKKRNMELRNQSMKKLKKNSHNNENICARKYLFAKLYSR